MSGPSHVRVRYKGGVKVCEYSEKPLATSTQYAEFYLILRFIILL